MEESFNETKSLLERDFQIEFSSEENNETLMIQMLSQRVAEMMDSDIDLLMSYLYRLDVEQNKIEFVINHQTTIPTHIGLAQLIWDRQKQRMETKIKYRKGEL